AAPEHLPRVLLDRHHGRALFLLFLLVLLLAASGSAALEPLDIGRHRRWTRFGRGDARRWRWWALAHAVGRRWPAWARDTDRRWARAACRGGRGGVGRGRDIGLGGAALAIAAGGRRRLIDSRCGANGLRHPPRLRVTRLL